MFLSTWFAHCSLAVESFLKITNGVPYFITQVCICLIKCYTFLVYLKFKSLLNSRYDVFSIQFYLKLNNLNSFCAQWLMNIILCINFDELLLFVYHWHYQSIFLFCILWKFTFSLVSIRNNVGLRFNTKILFHFFSAIKIKWQNVIKFFLSEN